MTVELRPLAEADLDTIYDYSAERWGAEQAERYIRLLWSGIERVASDPRHPIACDDVRPGYSRYRVGSHVVFLQKDDNRIVVVRILHERMDSSRHL